MSTYSEPMGKKTETGNPAINPPIKWESLFPQIFKRGGEVRTPKSVFRSKAKPKELNRKAKAMRESYEMFNDAETCLFIITPAGGVYLQGQTLLEFMAKEDDGLDDLLFAGWQVSLGSKLIV